MFLGIILFVVLCLEDNQFETIYPYKEYRMYALIFRKLVDFGIKFERIGNYIDSLGREWTSKVHLYKVDNVYFAPGMETSCCEKYPSLDIKTFEIPLI